MLVSFPFRNIQKKKHRAQQASSPREDLRTVGRMIIGLRIAYRMWQPVDKTDLNPEIGKLIPPIQSDMISTLSLTPKQQSLKKNHFKMFKIELYPQPALDKCPYPRSFCSFSLPSLICCYFVGIYSEISWGKRAFFYFPFLPFFSVQKYTVLFAKG